VNLLAAVFFYPSHHHYHLFLPPNPSSTKTPTPFIVMSTKGRSTPRVVCCAIPIARAAGKVLVITSRKRPNHWVCEYFFYRHASAFFFKTMR
jgi:hypothetical protein